MNKDILYLECKSGISGDMAVAALLDLGAEEEKLLNALKSLGLEGVEYKISRVNKNGLSACDFDVILPHHHHHEHHHEHRNLYDVYSVIDKGNLAEHARDIAKNIFKIVAEAEAKVHGEPLDKVHFHEVGALDSIADIVAVAVCIDDLGIENVAISELYEGSGLVKCQHGMLLVPVPATLEIARAHAVPLKITQTQGEMITPTGIAIVAALLKDCGCELPPKFTVKKTGYGAGKKNFDHPNILRAMLLEADKSAYKNNILLLEANIDDATGEQLGLAMEKLLENGAKDVHYIPAFAKKNRPSWLLRVIADETDVVTLEGIIFSTTTTIGIRKFPFERVCLCREMVDVALPYGIVKVKKCQYGENVFYYPEYESVKELSEKTGINFIDIFNDSKKGGN